MKKSKGMYVSMAKKIHLWIPILLLFINIFLTYFLIDELIDASPPNYGYLAYFTPIIGLISFLYIRKATNKNYTILIWVLQGLNWLFIAFPFVVILFLMSYFI